MFELEGMLEEKRMRKFVSGGKLSCDEIAKYAQSRGWRPVVGVKGSILVFAHPRYRFRQLVIQKDKTDDYGEAIFEVLRRIQECEGRLMRDIMRDMRTRRKTGLSLKVRLMPCAKWQKRPEFSRHCGYLAWLFIYLNFSWGYDD